MKANWDEARYAATICCSLLEYARAHVRAREQETWTWTKSTLVRVAAATSLPARLNYGLTFS